MRQKDITVEYDTEADLIEITIGKPAETVFIEVEDDVFEGRDPENNASMGFKIFNSRYRPGIDKVFLRVTEPGDHADG